MDLFALGDVPDSWSDVLLLPLFFTAVGIAIWVGGRNAELKAAAKPWKWFAGIPFALALVSGWKPFMDVRDSFYQAAIEPYGRKMAYAHYAAFLVPLLGIVGLAAWQYYDQYRSANEG